jgi:hypothetical protein
MTAFMTCREPRDGREYRDRGAAVVAAVTLTFVFMAGAFVWLSTTVDQSLHDRGQAAAVAFQAARAAAQEIDDAAAHEGRMVLDRASAAQAARATVAHLLASNGDSGSLVGLRIDDNRVTVTVEITTTGRAVTGSATATAQAAFDAGNT